MRDEPKVGDRVTHTVTVTPEMTARLFGREYHRVYGTTSMVLHVEEAGRLLIEPHLGTDEDAVGSEITVRHARAARVGDRLEVRALVTAVDARSCTVEAEVVGPDGVVGRGSFVQRFIRKGQLEEGTSS
jgi:fluoroacetyl-CoA thioesterase